MDALTAQLNALMNEHIERSRASRLARIERWKADVGAQNDGREPTIDSNCRAHAPHDCYRYDDGQRDGTYMAGEYLPIPFDVEEIRCTWGDWGPKQTERVTHCDPWRAKQILDTELESRDWLKDSYAGEEFDYFGQKACYVYIRGRVLKCEAAMEAIRAYLQAPLKSAKDDAEAREAARYEAADPVPTEDKRIVVTGTLLSTKETEGFYGYVTKCLVLDDRGFKLWGTLPATIDCAEIGDRITFTARLEPSVDDPKFGFFTRPTKAANLSDQEQAA
jgi:hypothetical protein